LTKKLQMIISVTNLKGGVGKSTISRNLAVYFAQKGEKTCIIDTDIEQRGSSDWFERRDEEAIRVPVFPMSSTDGLPKDVKAHRHDGYSVIIIDGVPQLGKVATKMLLISDLLIIPIRPSIEDLKSFEKFLDRFEDAKAFRDEIPAYLLLNMYKKQINEDKEVMEALDLFAEYDILRMEAKVGDRVAHRTSSKYGLTALEWDDKKAKEEIVALGSEIENILTKITA